MGASLRQLLGIPACILLITLAAPMRAAAQTESDAPAYQFPAGWLQNTNAANGITTLAPPDLQASSVCVLTIFPAQISNATSKIFHTQIVQQAASFGRVLEPPTNESVGAFLVTTLHQITPSGLLWVRIYTVRWNDRAQVLMLSVNSQQISRTYVPVVDDMIRTARSSQVARGPVALSGTTSSSTRPSTGPATAATTPNGATDIRGAGMTAGLYSATTMRYDAFSNTSVLDQYWYLFSPDGRVCRGYTLPKLPAGSNGDLRRFDFIATANADPENCGTFEVRGDQVAMRIGRRYAESIVFRAPDGSGKMTIQRASYSLSRRW